MDLTIDAANKFIADCLSSVSDVAIAVDVSSNITQGLFDTQLKAVEQMLKTASVGEMKTLFSYSTFSKFTNNVFKFGQYNSSSDMIIEVNKNSYLDNSVSHSNASDVLRYLQNEVFSSRSGSRAEVRKVLVFVSSGYFENKENVKHEMARLKRNNVTVVTVGVGQNIDISLLTELASDPALTYVVMPEIDLHVGILKSLLTTFEFQVCKAI